MIAHREGRLAGTKPRCPLERVKFDLSDLEERKQLFDRISSGSKRVLVITEGLLFYLTEGDVALLGADLCAQQDFHWWIIDILLQELLDFLTKRSYRQFPEGNVVMEFAPVEGSVFFGRYGWGVDEQRSVGEEARSLKREMPGAGF